MALLCVDNAVLSQKNIQRTVEIIKNTYLLVYDYF